MFDILVACEMSQVVTMAFRERGFNAFSNDLLPCIGGHPEWHIQCDASEALMSKKWKVVIAFPPCTDVAVSGARHFHYKIADGRQEKAVDFFMMFANAKVEHSAIENPVGIMSTRYRKPDQIIQPYGFGHDASKKTCLWLKNLPRLQPTSYVEPRIGYNGKRVWGNQTKSGQNKLSPSPDRAMLRGITYKGIGEAMADQWGNFLINSISN